MTDKPRPKYNFGASKGTGLSAIANKIWDQGKQEFGIQKDKPVVLERKELSDVGDKIKKDQQGQAAIVESTDASSVQPTFVFGQKLSERVLQPTHTSSDSGKSAENLFKSAAAAEKKTTLGDNDGTNGSTATTAERLRADAEQYSKDHEKDNNTASTSLIDVKTGEENDSTIHQFSCKIHSYDGAKKQWVERGLSSFKINQIHAADEDGWTSAANCANFRIVARTFGTMKLIINSPVFPDMIVEKVDERRVKITAVSVEGGAPQIFLLTSNLAKTDSIGEQMFLALKEVRERAKRVEEGQSRKRKAERNEEWPESVPETKKTAEEKREEEEDKDESTSSADVTDPVQSESGEEPEKKQEEEEEDEEQKELEKKTEEVTVEEKKEE